MGYLAARISVLAPDPALDLDQVTLLIEVSLLHVNDLRIGRSEVAKPHSWIVRLSSVHTDNRALVAVVKDPVAGVPLMTGVSRPGSGAFKSAPVK